MPELPEVETTVKGLNKKVLKKTFLDVWTDAPKIIKKPASFSSFKKTIQGKKIERIWRRGKNIIFDLSNGYSLLTHQKISGHFLYGLWEFKNGKWNSGDEKMQDRVNTYIHLVFYLDNGKMLALSDLRKFAKTELWKTDELLNSKEFKNLGPEPLEKSFTFKKFKKVLLGKSPFSPRLRQGKIKQVLMDPYVIAGIGNIYSSEALWMAKVHPEKKVSELNEQELKRIYQAVKKVLLSGVKLGGESFSDYRKIDGSKGDFDTKRKAYKREGQKCLRCGEKIKRIKVGQRSAFFCPFCQKL